LSRDTEIEPDGCGRVASGCAFEQGYGRGEIAVVKGHATKSRGSLLGCGNDLQDRLPGLARLLP
jgi:hypothetical protein